MDVVPEPKLHHVPFIAKRNRSSNFSSHNQRGHRRAHTRNLSSPCLQDLRRYQQRFQCFYASLADLSAVSELFFRNGYLTLFDIDHVSISTMACNDFDSISQSDIQNQYDNVLNSKCKFYRTALQRIDVPTRGVVETNSPPNHLLILDRKVLLSLSKPIQRSQLQYL